jgi:hypothetical protein
MGARLLVGLLISAILVLLLIGYLRVPRKPEKFLFVLTQSLEGPFYEILKVDMQSSEILKRMSGNGLARKIRCDGGKIYVLSYYEAMKSNIILLSTIKS